MRKKHLHGVIDCMVEVWISPVTFLLTLINRSNYSISIALRHRIYALHIAGIPNANASVTQGWTDTVDLLCGVVILGELGEDGVFGHGDLRQ